jgi:hypothetical protein
MKIYIPRARSGRTTLDYAKKFLVCCDGDKTEAKDIATKLFGPASDRGFGNSSIHTQIINHIDSIKVVRKPIK